jgi:hypothetical protein
MAEKQTVDFDNIYIDDPARLCVSISNQGDVSHDKIEQTTGDHR